MEIRQLEYFLMVCEEKNFTSASRRLYISQPAITNAISMLEVELGIKLFVRSKKGISLTHEGKVFYNYVKIVMNDLDQTLVQMNNLKDRKEGLLKVAVPPVVTVSHFFPAQNKFQRECPGVKLHFMSAETEHAEMLIEQQGYDIVLFFGDSSSEGEDTERLISGEIALFSSRTASLEQQLSDSDQILILAGEYNFSNAVKQLLEPFAHCTVQTVSSVEVMQTLLLDENACAVLPNFIRFRGRKIKMHPLPNSIEAHLYAKINLTNATSPVRSFVQCFIGQAKGERL